MDEKALTDFALLVNEAVAIELLADSISVKSPLHPAAVRLQQQYGAKRPLSVRLSPPKLLMTGLYGRRKNRLDADAVPERLCGPLASINRAD